MSVLNTKQGRPDNRATIWAVTLLVGGLLCFIVAERFDAPRSSGPHCDDCSLSAEEKTARARAVCNGVALPEEFGFAYEESSEAFESDAFATYRYSTKRREAEVVGFFRSTLGTRVAFAGENPSVADFEITPPSAAETQWRVRCRWRALSFAD